MKEQIARLRKGEETLAKLLKEGEDTKDFAIQGKGKGEVWKRKVKKKGEGGGNIMIMSNLHL